MPILYRSRVYETNIWFWLIIAKFPLFIDIVSRFFSNTFPCHEIYCILIPIKWNIFPRFQLPLCQPMPLFKWFGGSLLHSFKQIIVQISTTSLLSYISILGEIHRYDIIPRGSKLTGAWALTSYDSLNRVCLLVYVWYIWIVGVRIYAILRWTFGKEGQAGFKVLLKPCCIHKLIVNESS